MTRGLVIAVSPVMAVQRARSMIGRRLPPPRLASGWPAKTIGYELTQFNGGKDPTALHPGTWNPTEHRYTCDCSGFAAWALGFDRYQATTFPRAWINTDSMLVDAEVKGEWFEAIDAPEPGCIVVYGSIREGAKRVRVGHVGLVVEVPERPNWTTLKVVHCSSGNERRTGSAIQETSATIWDKPGSRFLRYRRAAPF